MSHHTEITLLHYVVMYR